MRLLEKNKQNLKYALQVGEVPVYERDEDGNIIYIEVDGQKVPVETGETEPGYSNPIDFRGNIAMSGGEAEAKSFGVDISEYDAILLMEKNRIPIDETSLIWHTSKVRYIDEQNTIVDRKSADYSIKRVQPSLNFTRYLLKRIVK
ncbi:hypothetical protein [[Ruminococcus] torques]|jgi:hypothetical protein|uniref:hypothetical protein n=1 Tax=[Ruminococcus] torques TaxID=33039 RepID=UPI003990F482